MGMMSGLGGFSQGLARGMGQTKDRRLREKELAQQAARDAANQQLQQFQMEQMTRQKEIQDKARIANQFALDNQGTGLSGYTDNWAKPQGGVDMSYADPSVRLAAQSYMSPADKQAADLALLRKQLEIKSEYKDPVKPSYDVIENTEGVQRYLAKGSEIPQGWKVSKPAAVQIDNTQGKPIQTEKTRLITLANSGLSAANQAKDLFFPNGEFDTSLAKILAAPDMWTASGGAGEKASQAFNALYGAVQDKLRLESGAAIPPEEIKSAMRRYMPGALDTPETASIKLMSLFDTLSLYKKLGEQGIDVKSMVVPHEATKPSDADSVADALIKQHLGQ